MTDLRLPALASQRGGILFVVSAPSGTGKTTLCHRLIASVPRLRFSISATTRSPRAGETDGVDYHFVDASRFAAMVSAGELLEWAEVHGNRYGTPVSEWRAARGEGVDLVLDIDTQGALQVRARMPESALIFVLPPSAEELERRIRGRGKDDDATIRRRLAGAAAELALATRYDYVIVNDDLARAERELAAIVCAERARAARVLSPNEPSAAP